MAIGVYRLYVAHAWTGTAAYARLVAALDALPTFLYRIDRIAEADAAAYSGAPAMLRDIARVAMTQSHIAIVDPALLGGDDNLARLELELAQTGFRRRIPILGVTQGREATQTETPAGVDRVVGLAGDEIVVAIQELAEEAAAERRADRELAAARPLKVVTKPAVNLPMQSPDRVEAEGTRALPMAEIMASLAELKTAREQQSQTH